MVSRTTSQGDAIRPGALALIREGITIARSSRRMQMLMLAAVAADSGTILICAGALHPIGDHRNITLIGAALALLLVHSLVRAIIEPAVTRSIRHEGTGLTPPGRTVLTTAHTFAWIVASAVVQVIASSPASRRRYQKAHASLAPWEDSSYLVIPVLTMEGRGMRDASRRSSELMDDERVHSVPAADARRALLYGVVVAALPVGTALGYWSDLGLAVLGTLGAFLVGHIIVFSLVAAARLNTYLWATVGQIPQR